MNKFARGIVGMTAADRIRFANLIFGVIFGAVIWFGHLASYGWVTGVYLIVIFGSLLVAWVLDWRGRRRGDRLLDCSEDLDRPDGPYDRLHGRIKSEQD